MFADPPVDSKWDIVKGYARRVRCLNFLPWELDPSIISYVSSRLESPSDGPYLLPKIRLIFCSSVERGPAFLSIIQMMPPDLQAIDLHFFSPDRLSPTTVTQIFNTLSTTPFGFLTSISIGGSHNIESESLEALFSLVQLQSNLETLELRNCRLTADSLSRLGQQTQLTSLVIQHCETSIEAVAAMFSTIGSLFGKLSMLDVWLHPELQGKIGVSTIAGLSSCRDIRRLVVRNTSGELLTSQMVSEMGRWWPSMEEFSFTPCRRFNTDSGTPLNRLYDIARVWSSTLRSLGVTFSFGGHFPPVPETTAVKFRHLKSITVFPAELPDDEFANIAEFLAAVTKPYCTVLKRGTFIIREYGALNERVKAIREVQ